MLVSVSGFTVDLLDSEHAPCAAATCFAAADTVGQLRARATVLALPLCWAHADAFDGTLVVEWVGRRRVMPASGYSPGYRLALDSRVRPEEEPPWRKRPILAATSRR